LNRLGVIDPSGRDGTTTGGNFYNFDVNEEQTEVAELVRKYLSEIDYNNRNNKAKLLQA
ncbi:MAG: hypothetical protein IH840_06865, partial [Candidatus Heimdallarchaeota archaeon]|nr:hypothetical protein [Candidatus Heimdallarchaeota archaeon]